MNRWQSRYQQFVESEKWRIICQFVGKLNFSDITDPDQHEEALRFQRMVRLISELLKVVDEETISQRRWDTIFQALDGISRYISNPDLPSNFTGDYQQLNSYIDQIHTAIRPYVFFDEAAAHAAGQAFRTYQKDVQTALEGIAEERSLAAEKIKQQKAMAQEYLNNIEVMKRNIHSLEKLLLGVEGAEENSLKTKFTETYNKLTEMKQVIETFNYKLNIDEEGKGSIIQQISDAKSSALGNEERINELLESIQKPINELNEFYIEVVGELNESGDRVGGLNQELQKRKKALLDFEIEQKERHEKLVDRIDDILKDATNAGLAHAYSKRKEDAVSNVKKNTKYFLFSLLGLFGVGSTIFLTSYNQTEWATLPLNLLKSSPVLVPIIWLATFFSKRRSEAHRLEQEYAHKEALARSYSSFKKQIEELKENDPKLLEILLDKTIAAVAFNPSVTLDKKHSSESPAREVADKILPDKET